MEYIFQNWSELNLIDRAWFVVGAWLLVLFVGVFVGKGIQNFKKRRQQPKIK